jgi:LPXTG-motif cell wall-anchored protein
MMWAKRVLIGSGLAVASLLVVPAAAGAATTGNCIVSQSLNEPTCAVVPTPGTAAPAALTPDGGGDAPTVTPVSASPSSLPFTGADVEELAVVGAGAVLAGGLLLRRRRMAAPVEA